MVKEKCPGNPYLFLSPVTGEMYHPDSVVNLHKKILKEAAALFFDAFPAFSNPLESKSFRVSNETRTKGDPMQAQRSGLHGEKEETRSTAEEKAATF